jgi:hypothetical protein
MRKIIGLAIYLVLSMAVLIAAKPVSACATWCEPPACLSTNPNGSCDLYETLCKDYNPSCNGGSWTFCPSGYYACSNGAAYGGYGSCCPVGSGPGPVGGGYAGEWGYGDNYPAGSTIDLNTKVSNLCLANDPQWSWWKGHYYKGTAQRDGVCCATKTIRGMCIE